jgi:hypothetical protein
MSNPATNLTARVFEAHRSHARNRGAEWDCHAAYYRTGETAGFQNRRNNSGRIEKGSFAFQHMQCLVSNRDDTHGWLLARAPLFMLTASRVLIED